MKPCTRCKKTKPMSDYRLRARIRQGRVATCKDCEEQLGRVVKEKRTCACGTVLASDNPSKRCGLCTRATTDARYGNPAALLKVEQHLRERLLRFGREIERVTTSYRSIADRPSPEAYLEALTAALDGLCGLVGVEAPVIEDVFPREFVELVTGGTVGIVISEGVGGTRVGGEVGVSASAPSELSEVSA